MRRWISRLVVATVLTAAMLLPTPASAGHPFEQGRVRLSLSLGYAGAFNQTYYAGGGGFAVYVLDGLEVGVDGVGWFGRRPAIGKLSPGIRYVAWMVPTVHPYVGAFYRHWFIGSGFADYDTAGGRGGIIVATRRGLLLGLGAAYETALNQCSGDCDWAYPEVWLSVSL